MKNLSSRWQKLIVWLTGYLSIIAFVIAGGYLYKNTEHEEVKTSAKVALFVTAIFTAIDILRMIIQYCLMLASSSTEWISKTAWVIAIIQAVVFVVLFIVDMVAGFGSRPAKSEKPAEDTAENEETIEKA